MTSAGHQQTELSRARKSPVVGWLALASCLLVLLSSTCRQVASAEELAAPANSTTTTGRRLFTYAGPLLPSDWSLVSVLNERAVIGFNNGSARNSLISQLEPKDRIFLERLQNGTVYATPLASAKEKLSQWSTSLTSQVSKLGKSLRDQYEHLVNNKPQTMANGTTIIMEQ